jgi:hypothetical protein
MHRRKSWTALLLALLALAVVSVRGPSVELRRIAAPIVQAERDGETIVKARELGRSPAARPSRAQSSDGALVWLAPAGVPLTFAALQRSRDIPKISAGTRPPAKSRAELMVFLN